MTATALERLREMDGEIASSFKALEPFESITNRDGWFGLEVRQMLFNLGYEVKDVFESGNPDEETVDNLEVRVSETLAQADTFTRFGSPLAKSRRGSAQVTPPPAHEPEPEPGTTTLPPPKQRRVPVPDPAPQPGPDGVTLAGLSSKLDNLLEEVRSGQLRPELRQVIEEEFEDAEELRRALRALKQFSNGAPTSSGDQSIMDRIAARWHRFLDSQYYYDRSMPLPGTRRPDVTVPTPSPHN